MVGWLVAVVSVCGLDVPIPPPLMLPHSVELRMSFTARRWNQSPASCGESDESDPPTNGRRSPSRRGRRAFVGRGLGNGKGGRGGCLVVGGWMSANPLLNRRHRRRLIDEDDDQVAKRHKLADDSFGKYNIPRLDTVRPHTSLLALPCAHVSNLRSVLMTTPCSIFAVRCLSPRSPFIWRRGCRPRMGPPAWS